MTPRVRWTIGMLLALVIGLAVGLVIVAADTGDDEPTTVTVRETEPTEAAPETDPTSPTETVPDEGSGGVAPDGSGGLGY